MEELRSLAALEPPRLPRSHVEATLALLARLLFAENSKPLHRQILTALLRVPPARALPPVSPAACLPAHRLRHPPLLGPHGGEAAAGLPPHAEQSAHPPASLLPARPLGCAWRAHQALHESVTAALVACIENETAWLAADPGGRAAAAAGRPTGAPGPSLVAACPHSQLAGGAVGTWSITWSSILIGLTAGWAD